MSLAVQLSSYSLEHKKVRLAQILSSSSNTLLYAEAVRMMEEVLREWNSSPEYRSFVHREAPNGVISLDGHVVDEICRHIDARASRLLDQRQVLAGQALSSGDKESIRSANINLAEAYWLKGDLQNCNKTLARARESCITDEHIMLIARSSVRFHLTYGNYAVLFSTLQRLSEVAERSKDKDFTFYCLTNAVVSLPRGEFQLAATSILQIVDRKRAKADRAKRLGQDILPSSIAIDIADEAKSIFGSLSDVMLFTVLTILGTCDRQTASKFLTDSDILQLLESDEDLRELSQSFLECRFEACVSRLASIEPRVVSSFYLFSEIGRKLLSTVRDAAIQLFTLPYASVSVKNMSTAFKTSESAMELELRRLIQQGKLSFRIDRASGFLRATEVDLRGQLMHKLLDRGNALVSDAEQSVRLMSLQRNEVIARFQTSGAVKKPMKQS